MAAQSSYTVWRGNNLLGMNADAREPLEIVTGIAAEALSPGDAVWVSDWESNTNVAENRVRVSKIDASTDQDKLYGFILFEHRQKTGLSSTSLVIETGQDVAILRKGVIWVNNTEGQVLAGNKMKILDSNFKLTMQAGAGTAYHGCEFVSSGAAGTLVKLQVNLPSYQS